MNPRSTALFVALATLTLCSCSAPASWQGSPNPLDSPAETDRTNWHGQAMGHFGPFGNGFNSYAP